MTLPRAYSIEARQTGDSTVTAASRTEVAQDVTAIAEKCLEDRLALIYLKSGGRALLKFLAAEKAKAELKKKDDKVVNLLGSIAVDLVVGVTERADLRVWGTLPAQVQLARLFLPPGRYTVGVRSSDGGLELRERNISVRSGKTEFVVVDDIR